MIKWKGNKLLKVKIRLHQPVSFPHDDNLHYFCSYVSLRDGPASGKNMRFRFTQY